MIYFEPPYLVFEGLTILRDHANPLQYYYYPLAPRLALQPDGSPAFLFVKYKQDPSKLPAGAPAGGGFLNFDVDLKVDSGLIADAEGEIKRKMRLEQKPSLVPLEYRSGSVKLILLDFKEPPPEGDGADVPPTRPTPPAIRFVEQASYAASPALFGDNRAAFSVQLTPEGATLVEETLDARSSLIGVVYDLTFVGLRPAYQVKLKVDWNRVFTFLEERFQFGSLLFSADIDTVVQELKEKRVIELDVTGFGAGAADSDIKARQEEATQFVKEFITEKFFEPSMNPKEGQSERWWSELGTAMKQLSPHFSGYTRRDFTRIDKKTLHIVLNERSAIERRILPQGHLQGLLNVLKQFPLKDFVREVDLNDPFFQSVDVTVKGGAAIDVDRIDSVKVHLDYGQEPKDVLLSKSGEESTLRWALDRARGRNYRYAYEVLFKPDAPPGKANRLVAAPVETNETRLVIDPRQLYQVKKVRVEPQSPELMNSYPLIEVNLRYRDATAGLNLEETLVLKKSSTEPKEWTFRLSDPTKTEFQYRATFFPAAGEPIIKDWQTSLDPAVILADPVTNLMKVTVMPAVDFGKVLRLMVDLSYEDPAHNLRANKLLTFSSPTDMQEWELRIQDPQQTAYRYRVMMINKDNTTKQLPPITSSDSLLIVSDSFRKTMRVDISANGKTFSNAELSKVKIRLAYDDPANSLHEVGDFTLLSTSDRAEWSFTMLDPAADFYTVDVKLIGQDGFERVRPSRRTNEGQLVIPID